MPKTKTPPAETSAAELRARRAEQRKRDADSLNRFHETVREALANDHQAKAPVPPNPTPKIHSPESPWAKAILDAVRLFNEPQKFLTEPPAGTPLVDLNSVQTVLDGKGHLLSAMTETGLVGFPSSDGHTDLLRVKTDWSRVVDLARRCASEYVREAMGEHLEELLGSIDGAITQALKDSPHAELILTTDFDLKTVWVRSSGTDEMHWVAGCVDTLPAKHPGRSLLPAELWFEEAVDGRVLRLVLLGPITPLGATEKGVVIPHHGTARPFYFVRDVARLTKQARLWQIGEWLHHQAPQKLDPEKYAQYTAIRTRYGVDHRPISNKPFAVPEQPTNDDRPWADKIRWAVAVLEKPEQALKAPPADTPIDDLLSARSAFSVANESRALHFASQRLAGRWFGSHRSMALIDVLTPVLSRTHDLIRGHLERGIIHASKQAAQTTSTLSHEGVFHDRA